MNEFENKIIKGIHASRYIASWAKKGGHFGRGKCGRFDFRKWLKSLGLEDDEVHHIYRLADNGKLELETSADKFMDELED